MIERDLAAAGFTSSPRFDSVVARSRAARCEIPALACCQGTPLGNEIEARDGSRLAEATRAATAAIAARFGQGPVDGMIRAHVVEVER